MAPSPEYDKEPKAPDKSATDISNEDSKLLQNLANDQLVNSDHKTTNSSVNSEVENNKHVETLDDEKLRALLDEAITYKCPKDREGKSSLFKELLEEVEQDEQACEAAARVVRRGAATVGGRGTRSRRALQHSNSLQDLVAALAAEPTPRRHARHPPPPAVSARAIHGGSLPSGVDTSSLLSEEGACGRAGVVGGGGGYLATVRCVNPPPLAERRVSASDANAPHELDMLNRRCSKPMFPMTYTARATLEIGSGAVCSGRAVTTTTASNQVRTTNAAHHRQRRGGGGRPRGRAVSADPVDPAALDRWYSGLTAYNIPPLSSPSSSHPHPPCRRDPSPPTLTPIRTDAAAQRYYETDYEIALRKMYRERVGYVARPSEETINPKNVKSMTIGKPVIPFHEIKSGSYWNTDPDNEGWMTSGSVDIKKESPFAKEDRTPQLIVSKESSTEASDFESGDFIELEEIVCDHAKRDNGNSFSTFVAEQEKLMNALELRDTKTDEDEYSLNVLKNNNNTIELGDCMDEAEEDVVMAEETAGSDAGAGNEVVVQLNRSGEKATGDRYILAELPNNAYIFLTLPKRLLTAAPAPSPALAPALEAAPADRQTALEVREIHDLDSAPEKRKKEKQAVLGSASTLKKKDAINKNALRVLLFENLLKGDRGETGAAPAVEGRSALPAKEVDAGIPFSCITSPEVVTGCSTTSSTAQTAAVALDPKPLQLCSEYRAVASLTGALPVGRVASSSSSSSSAARALAHLPSAAAAPAVSLNEPRSVIATSFNGLPLSRPNYGSTSTTANDEYKKSLDENGNAVQGYSSPLSGSSQHKKPRRKKSSKNETVIDCRQLDGYQGDKDVNELLRFIESDARDDARAPTKLRAKHKDDADDKISKKRSAERRKDKEKPPRASSLEERSRTTLEDLTAAPKTLATTPAQAPAKPERRSWGDAAPSVPTPALEPLEQADFQTVTKKRKPRRRTDEPPRRTRAPSPRPADSAPPSDRSNDSNDDMDSVHSAAAQPAALPPPAAPPHASYADIARTRHNIPDLIESCNFYAEGETEAHVPPPAVDPPAADPSYPALETATRRARDKPPPPRCARVPPAKTPPAAAAPDVLGDRRPPVILLDSTAQPRDMDGVTFGFDINEQLLGGATRRPKCDLVRDAVEAGEADGGPAGGGGGPGVPVRAGCTALRYLPPADRPPLQLIVDYVGMAWEEVMRCGGAGGGGGGSSGAPGKVRYYSE